MHYSKCELTILIVVLQQYNRMLQKLNIKRDRIADIQDAIGAADANNDSEIEYEEWRAELLV